MDRNSFTFVIFNDPRIRLCENAEFFTVLHLCTVLLIKYFLGVKQPEREADRSPPASAEMKNKGVMILLPIHPHIVH